jgi:hypothetical protein
MSAGLEEIGFTRHDRVGNEFAPEGAHTKLRRRKSGAGIRLLRRGFNPWKFRPVGLPTDKGRQGIHNDDTRRNHVGGKVLTQERAGDELVERRSAGRHDITGKPLRALGFTPHAHGRYGDAGHGEQPVLDFTKFHAVPAQAASPDRRCDRGTGRSRRRRERRGLRCDRAGRRKPTPA